jgi:hypothetical protein
MGWPLAVSAALMDRRPAASSRRSGARRGHLLAMAAILLPFTALLFAGRMAARDPDRRGAAW